MERRLNANVIEFLTAEKIDTTGHSSSVQVVYSNETVDRSKI